MTFDDLKLDPDEEDEEAPKHTYPRQDTPLTVVPRKDNAHGIGYSIGLSLSDALGNDRELKPSEPQISSRPIDNFRFIDVHTMRRRLMSGCVERRWRGRH